MPQLGALRRKWMPASFGQSASLAHPWNPVSDCDQNLARSTSPSLGGVASGGDLPSCAKTAPKVRPLERGERRPKCLMPCLQWPGTWSARRSMKVWAACSVMTSFFSLWSLVRKRTLSEECSVMGYWASGGLRTYRPAYRIKCSLDAHGCTSTFHHRSYWVVSTTRIAWGERPECRRPLRSSSLR